MRACKDSSLTASECAVSSLSCSLLDIVFQQTDFYACTVRALGHISVAHPNQVDAIDRDLVVQHQVSCHSVDDFAGVRDRSLALTRRESLHFFVGHFFEGACSFFKNLFRPSFWIGQANVKAENGLTNMNARSSARAVGLWLCLSDSSVESSEPWVTIRL